MDLITRKTNGSDKGFEQRGYEISFAHQGFH